MIRHHMLISIALGLITGIVIWCFFEYTDDGSMQLTGITGYDFLGVALISSIASYAWWINKYPKPKTQQQLWRDNNQCESCGYDMTANTMGRCPECGALR